MMSEQSRIIVAVQDQNGNLIEIKSLSELQRLAREDKIETIIIGGVSIDPLDPHTIWEKQYSEATVMPSSRFTKTV